MQHFLINFSICLFSLWLVYKLLLENVSWHYFKRFYLLGSLVISPVIPFLVVRTVIIPLPKSTPLVFPELEVMETTTATTGFEFEWSSVLLLVYVIGVLIMAFRFIKNLYALRIKSTDEIRDYEAYTLILRKLVAVPHSFLSRIYASVTDYKSGAIPDTVLQHEKAHLDQKHSWDILAIEVLLILMWFNPLLYLIKYSIKLNHEFLADQAVLAHGVDTKTYQETLLAYSSSSQNRALANTFNFPIIKKRFTIMKTRTSNTSLLLRTIAVLPVLAVLVISCGQEEIVVEPEVIKIVEQPAFRLIDEKNKIFIISGQQSGIARIEGNKFKFKRENGMILINDYAGNLQDFQKRGYEIVEVGNFVEEIEDVPIRKLGDSEMFRGKPISDSKKLLYPINDKLTYDLKSNMVLNSSLSVLEKKYGNNVIVISEMAEINGNEYYYAKDVPGKLFINEYFELVDVRGLSDGKINVSKLILPPPPPPLSPMEYVEANKENLVYYMDDKKISYEAAKSFIELTGQDNVEVSPDAEGKMAIKIKMTAAKT
jgi:beta-lactamase regulating signal transducer with metallopeptidase domain